MPIIRRKTNQSLARRQPKKDPYDLILIVCEGEKTEPGYFRDLILVEKLSYANIKVTGSCGSDPVSVVNEAIKRYEENIKEALDNQYDQVYCLIDRDNHPNFNSAIDIIHTYNKNIGKLIFFLIRSYPSFEYWYICHFIYTRASIDKAGRKSAGDRCVDDLNVHWRRKFGAVNSYKKNDSKVYTKINHMNSTAINNAKRGLKEAESLSSYNPSTEVGILLEHLLQVRDNKLPLRSVLFNSSQWIKKAEKFNKKNSTINTDNNILLQSIKSYSVECSNYIKALNDLLTNSMSPIYKQQLEFLLKILNDLLQKFEGRYQKMALFMAIDQQPLDTPTEST